MVYNQAARAAVELPNAWITLDKSGYTIVKSSSVQGQTHTNKLLGSTARVILHRGGGVALEPDQVITTINATLGGKRTSFQGLETVAGTVVNFHPDRRYGYYLASTGYRRDLYAASCLAILQ